MKFNIKKEKKLKSGGEGGHGGDSIGGKVSEVCNLCLHDSFVLHIIKKKIEN